jgi:N-acetylglucosaminyldiphosphoundecaprenol N-acetyl-beta-D-mannosaminyltransferase
MQASMNRAKSENILGYAITTQNRNSCIEQILTWIRSGEKGRYLICVNPHSLEIARHDRLFGQAIEGADIVTPDGIGMLLASKILGGSIRERVTGSDIFLGLSKVLNSEGGYRYFFLGSTEKNLALLQKKMKKDFPNIEIAGTYSPPFKNEFTPVENNVMIHAVSHVKPDVLWVGMTAPKQEKWVHQNKDRLNVKLVAPVGAVFDFYIDTIKRSPPWFLDHGLEWLPRLIQEPRRLWNRTLLSAPKFLMRVLIHRFLLSDVK